jgi:hypothetical protein
MGMSCMPRERPGLRHIKVIAHENLLDSRHVLGYIFHVTIPPRFGGAWFSP